MGESLTREQEEKIYAEAKKLVQERQKERQIRIDDHEKKRYARIYRENSKNNKIRKEFYARRESERDIVLQTYGDPCVNRYINCVVEYLKDNINVPVFGGTSYMGFFKNLRNKHLMSPSILCMPVCHLTASGKIYQNRNNNGENSDKYYQLMGNQLAYPMSFSVDFIIYDTNGNHAKDVSGKLRSIFEKNVDLIIPDPIYTGDNNVISVVIPGDETYISKSFKVGQDKLMFFCLSSKVCNTVYYAKKYTKEEIEFDPRRQEMLLSQVVMYKSFEEGIVAAKQELFNLYPTLVSGAPIPWYETLFYSTEFKYLKTDIDSKCNMSIIKPLFDKVFSKTMMYYPYLFERYLLGWNADQIENEMNSILAFQKEHAIALCRQLGIKFGDDSCETILNELRNNPLTIVKHQIEDVSKELKNVNSCNSKDLAFDKKIEEEIEEDKLILEKAKPSWVIREERAKMEADFMRQLEESQREANMRAAARRQAELEYAQNYYEEPVAERRSDSTGLTGALIGAAASYAGSKKVANEVRKLREEEAEREKIREREAYLEKSRAAAKSQEEWRRIKNLNDDRARKGLPPLPYPERWYY